MVKTQSLFSEIDISQLLRSNRKTLRLIIKNTWMALIETSTRRLLISEFKSNKPKKVANLPLRKSNKSLMINLAELRRDSNNKH